MRNADTNRREAALVLPVPTFRPQTLVSVQLFTWDKRQVNGSGKALPLSLQPPDSF